MALPKFVCAAPRYSISYCRVQIPRRPFSVPSTEQPKPFHNALLATGCKDTETTTTTTATATDAPDSPSASSPPPPPPQQKGHTKKPKASNPTSYANNFFNPDEYHSLASSLKQKKKEFQRLTPSSSTTVGGQQARNQQQNSDPFLFAKNNRNILDTAAQQQKKAVQQMKKKMNKKKKKAAQQQRQLNFGERLHEWRLLGDHLRDMPDHDHSVPDSTWVQVMGTSPFGSLDAMIQGVDQILNAAETQGMVDLDQQWKTGEPIRFLPPPTPPSDKPKWVRRARIVLSPFARPCGWLLQFDNRSIVYALMASDQPLLCASIPVQAMVVPETKRDDTTTTTSPIISERTSYVYQDNTISDHTIRIENCPERLPIHILLNYLSRYDLMPSPILSTTPSSSSSSSPQQQQERQHTNVIRHWRGRTPTGVTPCGTFLVHMADAAWARAVLREQQHRPLPLPQWRVEREESNGLLLLPRIVQYPQQLW